MARSIREVLEPSSHAQEGSMEIKRLGLKKSVLAAFLLLATAAASGNTLYSSPWMGVFNGYGSSVNSQEIASSFTLSQDTSVLGITWSGLMSTGNATYVSGSLLEFNIRFFETEYLPPVQALWLENRPTLLPFYQTNVLATVGVTGEMFIETEPAPRILTKVDFASDLPAYLQLDGGKNYWISISGTNQQETFDWLVGGTAAAVFRPCCNANGTPWYEIRSNNPEAVYSLHDSSVLVAVPEPETYAMMLAGFGLVGFMARRRKQSES